MTLLGTLITASVALSAQLGFGVVETEGEVLRRIHLLNQTEIQAGQLAEKNGDTQQVRDYGTKLVQDHSAADQKVQKLAAQEHLNLDQPIPAVDNPMNQKTTDLMNQLTAANGPAFDQTFAMNMDHAHRDAIATLKQDQENVAGTRTASLIGDLLPQLRHHEHLADKIERKGD